MHLEAKQRRMNTHRSRKRGRYGTENGPSKVARHFSQLIDGKLPCSLRRSRDIIFWLRDRIAKLKTRQIKKYDVLVEIVKFNARQIFPLYGIVYRLYDTVVMYMPLF